MKTRTFESLGRYHDSWATIILCAPDRFPEYDWDTPARSQAQRLEEAFADLQAGAHFAEKKIKTPRLIGVFRELLKMSHEAYLNGDGKRGAHLLQEAEGLVWRSRASRLKHVVEAERRAFGEVVLFKDVVVSPYPYEGSETDLGEIQRKLWLHATAQMDAIQTDEVSITQTWVADADGAVHVIKGRSRKAILQTVRDGAKHLQGYATASLIGPDLLCVDVEEHGKPRASVTRLTRIGEDPVPRFHLDEPEIFTQEKA
ncbi:hypothetical protein [Cupriavidus pauculus]|uniref:Uncharacterized protein n=1 Tax=Cupriavidus pauculus TaxID=82633 RepID=A0A2N5C867_9BURK|nr:hypothetical protein [Cupriavidus pauculus]PLP98416.1 hypothetical protein CYJ10_21195 [Cupriavidus pauculus]